jgi:hypothetical protein
MAACGAEAVCRFPLIALLAVIASASVCAGFTSPPALSALRRTAPHSLHGSASSEPDRKLCTVHCAPPAVPGKSPGPETTRITQPSFARCRIALYQRWQPVKDTALTNIAAPEQPRPTVQGRRSGRGMISVMTMSDPIISPFDPSVDVRLCPLAFPSLARAKPEESKRESTWALESWTQFASTRSQFVERACSRTWHHGS